MKNLSKNKFSPNQNINPNLLSKFETFTTVVNHRLANTMIIPLNSP